MSDAEIIATEVRPDQRSDETATVLTSDGANEHTEREEAAEAPVSGSQTDKIADAPETEEELESVEDADALPIIAQIPNPIFDHAGSAHVKEEDYDDDELQIITTPSPKRSSRASDRVSNRILSDKPKNVRARARKAAREGELVAITAKCKTKLPKRVGVVVDCAIMARDGCAVLENTTSTFRHVLYLSSPMPFTLVRSSLLTTSPKTGHVALLLQKTHFRLMYLPLAYMRQDTQIYAQAPRAYYQRCHEALRATSLHPKLQGQEHASHTSNK